MLKSNPVFRFFSSLKLAVISILMLASVLTAGTIVESLFGMRGAHVLVYGTWWFMGVLALLGTNVTCAALSRYPWKKHQTGFVVTHLGIIILLVGSLLTQRWGTDGNLPVQEGSENDDVTLNELRLTIWDDETNARMDFPLPETAREKKGGVMEVALGKDSRLVVESFMPRAVPEKKIVASPYGIGVPALQLELYNSRFKVEEWILSAQPEKATELNLGPAVLSFQKLWKPEQETAFLNSAPPPPPKKDPIGLLVFQHGGREFRAPITEHVKKWKRLPGSSLELIVDRYLPYAIVDKNELISKSSEPRNPAVTIRVRNEQNHSEKHTVFAFFPEFTTMHRDHAGGAEGQGALGLKIRMVAASDREKEELAIVGSRRGQLQFAQSADNRRLLYRSLSASGQINGKGEVKPQTETSTGWMDLQFKVAQWHPFSVQEQKPRYVDYIAGGDTNFLTSVYVRVEEGRKPASGGGRWLVEGDVQDFTVNGRKISVQIGKTRTELPFKIFLKKFTIGTDPGTTKAAAYSSEVTVRDPANGVQQTQVISMNEPLEYAGFTLYQASYQIAEGQPPISVFSVNRDPGRWVKYIGSLLICLGAALMFYMNPHYWGILFGRNKKEASV